MTSHDDRLDACLAGAFGRREGSARSVIQRLASRIGAVSEIRLDRPSPAGAPTTPVTHGSHDYAVVGRYVLLGELRRNDDLVIYRAHDRELGREVALEMPRREKLGDPRALEAFAERVRHGAGLQHPAIVPVYDHGVYGGRPFAATQLVAGRSLATVLDELADTDVPRVLGAIGEVARAIAYAHGRALAHGSLEPRCVTLGAFGEVHVHGFECGATAEARDVGALGDMLRRALVPLEPRPGALAELVARCSGPAPPAASDLAEAIGVHLTTAEHAAEAARVAAQRDRVRADAARFSSRLAMGALALAGCALIIAGWFRFDAGRKRDAAREATRAARASAREEQSAHGRTKVNLDRFDLLSNVVKLREARVARTACWPAWPENERGIARWLNEHGEPLERALPAIEGEIAAVRETAGRRERYLRETLVKLAADLREFALPRTSALGLMRQDLVWARTVHDVTIVAHEDAWRRAREAIRASPRYGGLDLTPQIGLVPLGVDPKSGLWEFVHVRSGSAHSPKPRRDDATGRLRITRRSGIVLVLLPGGDFTMGAQRENPQGPNYDPISTDPERPLHEVRLDPFFLSKYELTQSQYRYLIGDGPRGSRPASSRRVGWTHPKFSISWNECTAIARRHGLQVPTEAQWEYGCRAGTETPWHTGPDPGSLEGYTNVSDRTASRRRSWPAAEFDDGYELSSPVGSFLPNAFGLFDMHGNVNEYCRDRSPHSTAIPRPGDGLRVSNPFGAMRSVRGGAYSAPPSSARSTRRGAASANDRRTTTGVRFAREVIR